MAYRYTDNTRRVEAEHRNVTWLALTYALNDIQREANSKTPKKFGPLRANVRKTVRGNQGKIKWGQRYAYWQERGYTSGKVRKYTTPGTGAHFARNAVLKVTSRPSKYYKMAGVKL